MNLYWGATPKAADDGSTKSADPGTPTAGQVTTQGNHIWFYSGVNQHSASTFNMKLAEMSLYLRKAALDLGVEPGPIHMHIHSYGGEVYAGLAIADAIINCPLAVHTHIEGGAASAATIFSVVGKHRTIGANSYLLIHQITTYFRGKHEEWKDETANLEALMARLRTLYARYTGLSPAKAEEIMKHDLWFDARRALEDRMVDEIRG